MGLETGSATAHARLHHHHHHHNHHHHPPHHPPEFHPHPQPCFNNDISSFEDSCERSIKLEVQDPHPFNHPFFGHPQHPHQHPSHHHLHENNSHHHFPRHPLHHEHHHHQRRFDDYNPPPPPHPPDRYEENLIQDLSRCEPPRGYGSSGSSSSSSSSSNNHNNHNNNNNDNNNHNFNNNNNNHHSNSFDNNHNERDDSHCGAAKLVNGYHHHHHQHHHDHDKSRNNPSSEGFQGNQGSSPPPSDGRGDSSCGRLPSPTSPSTLTPSLTHPRDCPAGSSPTLGPSLGQRSPPPPGSRPPGHPPPPPMSPRGQQCERGMVENSNLLPCASDGEMGDDAMGHGGAFDRPCSVSQRQRGPAVLGAGSGGGEDPPGGCAGCGRRIVDRYYLQAVDKQWHVQCLTCSDCHFRLDSELTCFARDGQIYCKEDYYRRFAIKRCSRCQLGISANELVMRARDQVFHLSCFACSACNRTLTPGEEFGLRDNLIYCRTDYELIFQGDYIPSLSPGMGHPGHSPNPNGSIPFYNGVGGVQKGRPRKRKSPLPDGDGCTNMGLNGLDVSDRPGDVLDREGYGHTPPRQKRVRTSFKHHQLRTMKSYFALNHNPDAKDLKQLAQKTGLSKRVLQVWFQNARAKYRRNLLKQQQDSDKPGQGAATSPSGADNKESLKEGSGSITDLSNTRSPALSDISSTPSLSDLHSSAMDSGGDQSSSSITELFSSTIASIN